MPKYALTVVTLAMLAFGCGAREVETAASVYTTPAPPQPPAAIPAPVSPYAEDPPSQTRTPPPRPVPLIPTGNALNSGSQDAATLEGIEALGKSAVEVAVLAGDAIATPFSTVAVRVAPAGQGASGLLVHPPQGAAIAPGQEYTLRLTYHSEETDFQMRAAFVLADAPDTAEETAVLELSNVSIPRARDDTPWKTLQGTVRVPNRVEGPLALKLFSERAREPWQVDMLNMKRK